MALPKEVEEHINGKPNLDDSFGLRILNTGTIVTQNNELTFEILEAWGNCTTGVRYPGCAEWKWTKSHEQRAFSEYIRYDYNKTPETIIAIPTEDAMSYPEYLEDCGPTMTNVTSRGDFIRHYTMGKHRVHGAVTETMAQPFFEALQKNLLKNSDEYWKKEVEPVQDESGERKADEREQVDE